MKIKDGLNLLNLTDAEIVAYDAGAFLEEGSLLYDTTNKQVTFNNGTESLPVGFGTGTEIFQEETIIYPWQFGSFQAGLQNFNQNVSRVSVNTSPIFFNREVELKEIRATVNNLSSGGPYTGYCGVYELNSKATASGVNYYEYSKLAQFTPTFTFSTTTPTGEQILTISPTFKFKPNKIYVVICITDYTTGTQPSVEGVRRFGASNLLSYPERFLFASTGLPAPYTLSFTPPTLPNTIWFKGDTGNGINSFNPLRITVQNA